MSYRREPMVSDHFDDAFLAELCAGEADLERLDDADAHMERCAACRRLVVGYARAYLDDETGASPPQVVLPSATLLAQAWADARVGSTLEGKWTLERVLGLGGSGVVFEGRHRNKSRAAIKVLRPELAQRPEVVRRFLREGYGANSVPHPGIARVLDDGTTGEGLPYLVVELLDGETLREHVTRHGPMVPSAVAELLRNLAEVLDAAHARGVVHRDLKPENVFLEREGGVKLLDFGIAQLEESDDDESTKTGTVIGTSAFMAPEQARGERSRVGPRSDLFALGGTLLYALSGELPRKREGDESMLYVAMTQPLPRARAIAPTCPEPLARALDAATAFIVVARVSILWLARSTTALD